jgi:hypothetical protein
MRRRRRIFRWITRALATVAIGALVGFLAPTVATDLSPKPETELQVPESPLARQFVNAYTADDQGALSSLGVSADIKLRASRFRSDFSRIDVPIHLGSAVVGGATLHSYTAKGVRPDGSEELLGMRVVTAGGQIVLVPPPAPIEPA